MKGKRIFHIPLIALLLFSMATATARGAQPPFANAPTVWCEDKLIYTVDNVSSLHPEGDFNVTVSVYNVTDFGSWEFKLDFNASLLQAHYVYPTWFTNNNTDWVPTDAYGNYHPDDYPTIDNTTGRVYVGAGVPAIPGAGPNGSFPLVKIEFHIIAAPERDFAPPDERWLTCDLDVHSIVLGDSWGVAITPTYDADGFYNYTRPQKIIGWPEAHKSHPATAFVGDPVLFDASASTDGGWPPLTYRWDFDYNVNPGWDTTTVDPTKTATWTYTAAGVYTVVLNVTNSIGKSDQINQTITIEERLGPLIDLYDDHWRQYPEGTWTDFVGKGAGTPSDSYAPGENVTLFANVTYNGDIVQNIWVGFEVKDPLGRITGEPFLVRSARTNETGIATTWFRIPIPCSPEEQEAMFGHWLVIAKCKLQDEIINDTKEFSVGWIVEITGLDTFGIDEVHKNDWFPINITFKNIALLPRNVVIVVVLYDECDVPVAQIVIETNITASTFCHPVEKSITTQLYVPKWAYVGTAKLYANAFTYLPQDCGIPYCPEVYHGITIRPAL